MRIEHWRSFTGSGDYHVNSLLMPWINGIIHELLRTTACHQGKSWRLIYGPWHNGVFLMPSLCSLSLVKHEEHWILCTSDIDYICIFGVWERTVWYQNVSKRCFLFVPFGAYFCNNIRVVNPYTLVKCCCPFVVHLFWQLYP